MTLINDGLRRKTAEITSALACLNENFTEKDVGGFPCSCIQSVSKAQSKTETVFAVLFLTTRTICSAE